MQGFFFFTATVSISPAVTGTRRAEGDGAGRLSVRMRQTAANPEKARLQRIADHRLYRRKQHGRRNRLREEICPKRWSSAAIGIGFARHEQHRKGGNTPLDGAGKVITAHSRHPHPAQEHIQPSFTAGMLERMLRRRCADHPVATLPAYHTEVFDSPGFVVDDQDAFSGWLSVRGCVHGSVWSRWAGMETVPPRKKMIIQDQYSINPPQTLIYYVALSVKQDPNH